MLDCHKLGLQIVAFVEMKGPQVAHDATVDRFKAAVLREPAFNSHFVVAGQFDFLLKIVA